MTGPATRPVFIDATEWGEVLVLADAPYLQGVGDRRRRTGGGRHVRPGDRLRHRRAAQRRAVRGAPRARGVDKLGFGSYNKFADAWDRIWTYRRIKGNGSKAAVGDICLQNWGYSGRDGEGGNDYPFGYLFKSKAGRPPPSVTRTWR